MCIRDRFQARSGAIRQARRAPKSAERRPKPPESARDGLRQAAEGRFGLMSSSSFAHSSAIPAFICDNKSPFDCA
eukprot:6823511-Alexandrium_andersonii.AAC.1